MAICRVVMERLGGPDGDGAVRWERSEPCESGGAFLLLGRAFEVAQREMGAGFAESLQAFFRGALIARADLEEVVRQMENERSDGNGTAK